MAGAVRFFVSKLVQQGAKILLYHRKKEERKQVRQRERGEYECARQHAKDELVACAQTARKRKE